MKDNIMGYGGNLIWTSVLSAIRKHDNAKPVACFLPGISDLMAGYLYDRSQSCEHDVVFQGNPDIHFLPISNKTKMDRILDNGLKVFLKVPAWRQMYESYIFKKSELVHANAGQHFVHIDMQCHSYASHQTRRKTFWKTGRAEHAMAKHFGVKDTPATPKLYFDQTEHEHVQNLLATASLNGPFIVVEPDTNCDWFGELRAWPFQRWQAVCDTIKEYHPDIPIVQIGLGRLGTLKGCIDLTNKTSFREAALVIKQATLFMGTEGGLMHAARAVNAKALILWGGITLPEFIGYPEHQTTLCKYVNCAPCGNAGWCEQSHKCMNGISIEDVTEAALALIK
ncbi:MAG: hypothetical protein NUV50_11080 [Rhodospirillales bacterium]|nr:hypothetical protein [Rhodospirillales bacterium]